MSTISWLLPEDSIDQSQVEYSQVDTSGNPLQEMEEILSTLQLLEVESGTLPASISNISNLLARYLEVIETVKKLKSEK